MRRILGATPARLFRAVSIEVGVVLLLALFAGIGIRAALIQIITALLPLPVVPRPSLNSSDLILSIGAAGIIFVSIAIRQGVALGLFSSFRGLQDKPAESEFKVHRISNVYFPLHIVPATMFLILAILLGRNAYDLLQVETGVLTRNVFICEVSLPFDRLRLDDAAKPELRSFFLPFLQQLEHAPMVVEFGVMSVAPYSGYHDIGKHSYASLSAGQPPQAIAGTLARSITPGAVPALGMKILYGRNFARHMSDDDDHHAVLINQSLADHFGAGPSALGREIRFLYLPGRPPHRIIGIVNNVRERDLLSPVQPTIYFPFVEWPSADVHLVVRTFPGTPSGDVLHVIQATVHSITPQATISGFAPLSDKVYSATAVTRYVAYFLLALAFVGVFLAGLCAWLRAACDTRRRNHEIGVRLALGATPAKVVLLVVQSQLLSTAAGALAGVAVTFWFSRLLSRIFFVVATYESHNYWLGAWAITLVSFLVAAWSATKAVRCSPRDLLSAQTFG